MLNLAGYLSFTAVIANAVLCANSTTASLLLPLHPFRNNPALTPPLY